MRWRLVDRGEKFTQRVDIHKQSYYSTTQLGRRRLILVGLGSVDRRRRRRQQRPLWVVTTTWQRHLLRHPPCPVPLRHETPWLERRSWSCPPWQTHHSPRLGRPTSQGSVGKALRRPAKTGTRPRESSGGLVGCTRGRTSFGKCHKRMACLLQKTHTRPHEFWNFF